MKTNFKADIVYHLKDIYFQGDLWVAGFDIFSMCRR